MKAAVIQMRINPVPETKSYPWYVIFRSYPSSLSPTEVSLLIRTIRGGVARIDVPAEWNIEEGDIIVHDRSINENNKKKEKKICNRNLK